ncbi:expansin-like B1 [Dendrobium catenatum]|uniref:Expansin-like B1 n=1 Tax=Dendrobium catenatum TaxID=906689 RepID=A0A2I0X491_9ASPA|nr:expansin-like B1 [Dendrobium catenatum]PKU82720.1 Expansin-like B1 [Dendrobium catenatum]
MALSLKVVSLLCMSLLQFQSPAIAATSFIKSRAAYYPNSEQNGTADGACGYRLYGATLNGGDVSAASDLYRNGVGCGACYQVRCTNINYCSDNGVTIVITDLGSSGGTDFILSQHAFARMGQTVDTGKSLLDLGWVDIEYARVSCSYPNKNITIKIDESSIYPDYLAFVIEYQQGIKDIIAVQLCETVSLTCKLLDRSRGTVWAVVSPPSGPLSVRMLLSSNDDNDDESWATPINDIPVNWTPGTSYDSGMQIN